MEREMRYAQEMREPLEGRQDDRLYIESRV